MYLIMVSLRSSIVRSALIKSIHTEPKFCYNCKYILHDEWSDKLKYARCQAFPITVDDEFYLVTGEGGYDEYAYCSTARSWPNMCGPEGLKYVAKEEEEEEENKEVPEAEKE